jgi:hypothetical protein
METEEIRKILPEPDVDYLLEKEYKFDVHQVGSDVHVIINDFAFPDPYRPNQASLLIILPAGYPSANPDMFWTHPDIKLSDDRWPTSSEYHQDFDGKSWQRWSRHMAAGGWRAGVDNLRTYMTSVSREIMKGL